MSVKVSKEWNLQSMFIGSPQTVIITKEGFSMNVSTILLKTFSTHLATLLSLPHCVSSAIIIPDFSLYTVSNLLEIMTKGFASQFKDTLESKTNMKNVLELAKVMGFSIKTLTIGKKQNTTVVTHNDTDVSNFVTQPNTGRIIEENQVNLSTEDTHTEQNCEIEPDMKLENKGMMESIGDGRKIHVSVVKTVEEDAFLLDTNLVSRYQTCENRTKSYPKIPQIILSGNITKENGVKQLKVKPHIVRRKKQKKISSLVNFNNKVGSSEQNVKLDEDIQRYTDVESVSKCQVCKKSFPSETRMRQHLVITHFVREVRERCSNFFDGSKCLICDKTSKNIILHIGATHRKVNGILIERNYKPFSTLNGSKPKIRKRTKRSTSILSSSKLIHTTNVNTSLIKREIKEEIPDGEFNHDGLRESLVEQSENDNLDINQEPRVLDNIDQILAKYSMI